MKQASTLFLKIVLVIIAAIALAGYFFGLPQIFASMMETDPSIAMIQYPFFAYAYMASLPFYVGLYQAYQLLCHIDENKAFSDDAIRALQNIKLSAISIIGFISLGELYVMFGMSGDRAHIIAVGLYLSFAVSVVATFAAVLQKLVQNGVDIKSENDLTV